MPISCNLQPDPALRIDVCTTVIQKLNPFQHIVVFTESSTYSFHQRRGPARTLGVLPSIVFPSLRDWILDLLRRLSRALLPTLVPLHSTRIFRNSDSLRQEVYLRID